MGRLSDHSVRFTAITRGLMFTATMCLVLPAGSINITSEVSRKQLTNRKFYVANTTAPVKTNFDDLTTSFVAKESEIISANDVDEENVGLVFVVHEAIAVPAYKEKPLDESDNTTWMEVQLQVCGLPVFMEPQNCSSNSSVSSCMNYGKATAFGMTILIMGVGTISFNILIPVLVFANKRLRTQLYFMKASLAMADSIVGFLLTLSVLRNIVWVTGISKETLVHFPEEDQNSPHAVTVGGLLTVSVTASLLHLAYMSVERFTAIKWPLQHMKRGTTSVIPVIACMWAISLATAFVPAAFPTYFAYQFQPTILMHIMSMQQANGTMWLMWEWRGMLYGSVIVILPYVVMSFICVMTIVEVHRKIKKFKKTFGGEYQSNTSLKHGSQGMKKGDQEISVFITVGMMISAFSLTFLPFMIVMILFVAGILDCDNYTIPYVLVFYVAMLNGLANVLIYSVRDQRFRQAVKDFFPCSKSPQTKGNVITQSQTISSARH